MEDTNDDGEEPENNKTPEERLDDIEDDMATLNMRLFFVIVFLFMVTFLGAIIGFTNLVESSGAAGPLREARELIIG